MMCGQVREGNSVNVTGVGAQAVFNAIRSVAVARDYLKQRGEPIDLYFQPEFTEIQLEGPLVALHDAVGLAAHRDYVVATLRVEK